MTYGSVPFLFHWYVFITIGMIINYIFRLDIHVIKYLNISEKGLFSIFYTVSLFRCQ